jgi:AcrR family transcriptional regulator
MHIFYLKLPQDLKYIDTIPSGRYSNNMNKTDRYNSTRDALLDAANRVLTSKGAEGFTLDAVAQEAAVSKGGLLYHFPSKNSLIEGMIARSAARIDAALEDELEKAGGDYLTAYIRASFRTVAEPEQVSRALSAAIANDPGLMEPIRARFERLQREIAAAAPAEEIGTLIRLALDGLWYAEMYRFAPPPPELRQRLMETLLTLAHGRRLQ